VAAAEPTLDLIGAAALAISGAVWSALGLEQSGTAALNVVLAEPGISIRGLSHVLGLSHSATVRVADRLQREGLITRDWAGPGRTIAVKVTGRGRQRALDAAARRTQVLQQAASGLTAAQRQSLHELLQQVVLSLADDQAAIDRACRLCDQQRCLARGCPLPA
jgi:MarR family transcriptional regulator, negative regulator of the multidrug operon emrRAB